jgi:cell fate (sporulation/competence/biofilm development) regulator YmcA (YheA/YmcA/DUF963 family)
LGEKYNEEYNKIYGPQNTGLDLFYEFKKKYDQAELENLNDLINNAESIKDFDQHKEEINNPDTLIEALLDVKDEMSAMVIEAENAWKQSRSTAE